MRNGKGAVAVIALVVLALVLGGGLAMGADYVFGPADQTIPTASTNADESAVAPEEVPCPSCDVILLNEYPDYVNR